MGAAVKRLVAVAFIPMAVFGVAACTTSSSNAPTAEESSWYASGPTSNPPIIPKTVCDQIQATVNNASKAIGGISDNASGTTQQELNVVVADLQSLLPMLPESYKGQINSIIGTLSDAGISTGERVQGLNEKFTAATGNIGNSCSNLTL